MPGKGAGGGGCRSFRSHTLMCSFPKNFAAYSPASFANLANISLTLEPEAVAAIEVGWMKSAARARCVQQRRLVRRVGMSCRVYSPNLSASAANIECGTNGRSLLFPSPSAPEVHRTLLAELAGRLCGGGQGGSRAAAGFRSGGASVAGDQRAGGPDVVGGCSGMV
jgi:hypothetical protein